MNASGAEQIDLSAGDRVTLAFDQDEHANSDPKAFDVERSCLQGPRYEQRVVLSMDGGAPVIFDVATRELWFGEHNRQRTYEREHIYQISAVVEHVEGEV